MLTPRFVIKLIRKRYTNIQMYCIFDLKHFDPASNILIFEELKKKSERGKKMWTIKKVKVYGAETDPR